MTTKIISNTSSYASGYTFTPPTTVLTITAGGYVGGTGVVGGGSAAYTVVNRGFVLGASDGISLANGGSVTNGGVAELASSAIYGYYGGVAINGAPGAVTNYGKISTVLPDTAVLLGAGGYVKNGDGDDGAEVLGGQGVQINGAPGTVVNLGVIIGVASFLSGVYLTAGGTVTNGSAGDTGAEIEGGYGVQISSGAGTVTNFGKILGNAGARAGIVLNSGGRVTNGTGIDTLAVIEGRNGIISSALAGNVVNFATVVGAQGVGVDLQDGGSVTNGSATDRVALIDGYGGVAFYGAAGAVTNGATILGEGGAGSYGVDLTDGGGLANGAINDKAALVEGFMGARLAGGGSSSNFGKIIGLGYGTLGAGVALAGASERLVNGSAADTTALISGYEGVSVGGAASTVTNFGTISGVDGVAVSFASPSDVLVVEAGSSFAGSVNGDGGTLDLASGNGTIVLAGSTVTVSGSMAATAFTDFATVKIAAGASFEVSGNNTGGLLVFGGTLISDGAVSGTGHLGINGGVADMGAGFKENVSFNGATGELKLGSSKTYTGKISGFSKTGTTSLDLLDIAFAGTTTAHYSGGTASGVLTVTEGANTADIALQGDYLSSTFTLSAAPGGGTLVVDPPKTVTPAHVVGSTPPHWLIAAMAGFGALAGGSVGVGADSWRAPPPMLAMPRAQIA